MAEDKLVPVITIKEINHRSIIIEKGKRIEVPEYTAKKWERRGLAKSAKLILPIGSGL